VSLELLVCRVHSSKAAYGNAVCMQKLCNCVAYLILCACMAMAQAEWCIHNNMYVSTSIKLVVMQSPIRCGIDFTDAFAGVTGAVRDTRRLLQQPAPLPDLTVQSFSDFSATQLCNVTAGQAAAASATAAASAAVAAAYHISECCTWG
jgi:hypothetical protein